MSMINCSECGSKISNAAEVCPNCGIKSAKKMEEDQQDNFSGGLTALGFAIVLLGLLLMLGGC